MEALPQFCRWYAISTSHVYNVEDVFIIKDLQLGLAAFRHHRTESITSLPGKPCPLYTTIFHAATTDKIVDERMLTCKITPASDLFGALAVCDENKTELFNLVNILQWLAIKQVGSLLCFQSESMHRLGESAVDALLLFIKTIAAFYVSQT